MKSINIIFSLITFVLLAHFSTSAQRFTTNYKPTAPLPTVDLSFSYSPTLHCPNQSSPVLPFARLSLAVKSNPNNTTPFTQPVLVFDATADTQLNPDAFYDSNIRLQCMIQNGNTVTTTADWRQHQQLDINNNISLHMYTILPNTVIPYDKPSNFSFTLQCLLFAPPSTTRISGFVSLIEVPEPSIAAHSFKCSRFTPSNLKTTSATLSADTNDTNDCKSFSFTTHNSHALPSPALKSPYNNNNPYAPGSNHKSISPTSFFPNGGFTLYDLKTSVLLSTDDWFIGNTTFIATGNASKLPMVAVSMTTTQLIDNDSRMSCFVSMPSKSAPLVFSERYGIYWLATIPQSIVPLKTNVSFSVFCEFKARYASTQHYISVVDLQQSSLMTYCDDPFQCNRFYPHTGEPNPAGQCVHISYK